MVLGGALGPSGLVITQTRKVLNGDYPSEKEGRDNKKEIMIKGQFVPEIIGKKIVILSSNHCHRGKKSSIICNMVIILSDILSDL